MEFSCISDSLFFKKKTQNSNNHQPTEHNHTSRELCACSKIL